MNALVGVWSPDGPHTAAAAPSLLRSRPLPELQGSRPGEVGQARRQPWVRPTAWGSALLTSSSTGCPGRVAQPPALPRPPQGGLGKGGGSAGPSMTTAPLPLTVFIGSPGHPLPGEAKQNSIPRSTGSSHGREAGRASGQARRAGSSNQPGPAPGGSAASPAGCGQ